MPDEDINEDIEFIVGLANKIRLKYGVSMDESLKIIELNRMNDTQKTLIEIQEDLHDIQIAIYETKNS